METEKSDLDGAESLRVVYTAEQPSSRTAWQFSLRTLLIVMTAAAVASAFLGWLGWRLAVAVLVGIAFAIPPSCMILLRATRGLRRGIRSNPVARICVATAWTGIECSVLIASAMASAAVNGFLGPVPKRVPMELITVGTVGGAVWLVAISGLAALLFAVPLAGALVLLSTRGFRVRFERPLSSFLGCIVGSIAWAPLAWDGPGELWVRAVVVPIFATTSVAAPPLLIWLADRRFPGEQFRGVSRETWATFDL